MTDEQVGMYVRLLCAQHLTGHLSEKQMLAICKNRDEEVWKMFMQDDAGNYYNVYLETEILKRKRYGESRAKNRIGKGKKQKKQAKNICKSYDSEEKKTKYRDNITLTETEYQKLCTEYGVTTAAGAIDYLASYKLEKNYTTKSDYLTIRRWVIDAVTKTKTNGHKPKPTDYLVAADGTKIYEKDIDFSKLGK
jgi:hypothetical protein